MTRKDKEEQIKAWKEGEAASPAGNVELDDSDLENASGGHTSPAGTAGCCGTQQVGTAGCCDGAISPDLVES